MSRANRTIRIAGNTLYPTLSVIDAKGYEIWLYYTTDSGTLDDCIPCFTARKEGRLFGAASAVELLGVIALWEARGENWRATEDDVRLSREILDSVPIYGPDGTIIEKFLDE